MMQSSELTLQLVISPFLFSLTETRGTNLHLLSILWDHTARMIPPQTAIQAGMRHMVRALFFRAKTGTCSVISELQAKLVQIWPQVTDP